eukprot:TRINITY_DN4575_c0_g1_i1.p1 TRINITY_DN4575_c0_g1~~TRINITY_DN4575_c0_g1_i1.p1  ORF type:complete len:1875 (+),score=604.74 TRINITY_DN4575_c0_g1_i1:191-5815(+)
MAPSTCLYDTESYVIFDDVKFELMPSSAIVLNTTMPTIGGKLFVQLSNFSGDFSTIKVSSQNEQIPCTTPVVTPSGPFHILTCFLSPGTGVGVPLNITVPGGLSIVTTFDYAAPFVSGGNRNYLSTSGGTIKLYGSDFGNNLLVLSVVLGSDVKCNIIKFNASYIECSVGGPIEGINLNLVVNVDGQSANLILVSFLGPIYRIGPDNSTLLDSFISNGPFYADITVAFAPGDYSSFNFSVVPFRSVKFTSEPLTFSVPMLFYGNGTSTVTLDGFKIQDLVDTNNAITFSQLSKLIITNCIFENVEEQISSLFLIENVRSLEFSTSAFSQLSIDTIVKQSEDVMNPISSVSFDGCSFDSNTFTTALYSSFPGFTTRFLNSNFTGNYAFENSSLLIFEGTSKGEFTNCLFDGNALIDDQKVITVRDGAVITVSNSTFSNNQVMIGIISVSSASLNTSNVLFTANTDYCGLIHTLPGATYRSNRDQFIANKGSSICMQGGRAFSTNSLYQYNEGRLGTIHLENYSTFNTEKDNFDSNTAQQGGVFYLDASNLISKSSNYTSNTANNNIEAGGAVYTSRTSNFTSNLDQFIGNTAPNGRGGAIYGNVIAVRTDFISNSARRGGALESFGSLTTCKLNLNSAQDGGGAIAVSISSLSVTSCTFENNTASFGGSILVDGRAVLSVNTNTFRGNTASIGGVFYVLGLFSTISVSRCVFVSNSAENGGVFGSGGAYGKFNSTSITFSASNFTSNRAFTSGGVLFIEGYSRSLTVSQCNFLLNSATKDGGVVCLSSYGSFGTSSLFSANSYLNNEAGGNGGVFSLSGDFGLGLKIANSTANLNVAQSFGGVFYVNPTSPCNLVIDSGTFDSNKGLIGAGLYSVGTEKNNMKVVNTIWTKNVADVAGGAFVVKGNFDGISIQSAEFTQNDGKFQGGAILLMASSKIKSFELSSSRLYNNSGIFGSGLGLFGGVSDSVNVSFTSFLDHEGQQGGGIYYDASKGSRSGANFTVTSSNFESNTASGSGGGIYLSGPFASISLNDLTFESNQAGSGGGIYFSGSTSSFQIQGIDAKNNSGIQGGFGFISCSLTSSESVRFAGLNLKENFASIGAGIYLISASNSDYSIESSDFDSNYAQESGGSLFFSYKNGGGLRILNGGFNGNHAKEGASVFLDGSFAKIYLESVTMDSNEGESSGSLHLSANIQSFEMKTSNVKNNLGLLGGGILLPLSKSINSASFSAVNFDSNRAINYGGSIAFLGSVSNVQMDGCNFNNDSSRLGGSVYFSTINPAAEVNISSSSFRSSSSEGGGGAIALDKSIQSFTLSDSSFQLNSVGNSSNGGGIFIKATVQNLVVQKCTFESNSAYQGGSAYFDSISGNQKRQNKGSISISDSQFNGGRATNGGSLYLVNSDEEARMKLSSSSFHSNKGTNGGAVYLSGSSIFESLDFTSNEGEKGLSLFIARGSLTVQDGSFDPKDKSIYLNSPDVTVKMSGANLDSSQLIQCPPNYQIGGTQCVVMGTDGTNGIVGNNGTNQGPQGFSIYAIIGIVVGVVVLVSIFVVILVVLARKKRKMKPHDQFQMLDLTKINLGAAKESVVDYDGITDMVPIGQGNFGIVYSAKWRQLRVAVKQIKSDNISEKQLQDFLGEVAILKSLRPHPNVVLFLGMTFPPQPLSLITEFCDGGNLYDYLREKTVDEATKSNMILNIARGMLHLHLEKVIHRDLAVRNILLSSSLEVKVSDFGMSREQKSGADVTSSETGPLKWMAPEAITRREYSPKSDVFSFGVVVWEIITVSEPFPELTPLEVAIEVATKGRRLEIPASASKKLKQIMNQCWEKDPNDRPDFANLCSFLGEDSNSESMSQFGGEKSFVVIKNKDDTNTHYAPMLLDK